MTVCSCSKGAVLRRCAGSGDIGTLQPARRTGSTKLVQGLTAVLLGVPANDIRALGSSRGDDDGDHAANSPDAPPAVTAECCLLLSPASSERPWGVSGFAPWSTRSIGPGLRPTKLTEAEVAKCLLRCEGMGDTATARICIKGDTALNAFAGEDGVAAAISEPSVGGG